MPPTVQVRDDAGLADVVWDTAAAAPDRVQFAGPGVPAGQEVTRSRFRDEVTALAGGFITAGVRPGDRVALMSRTRYEWTLTDYAVLACGAVTVPIYPTASAEQVAWTLADCGAVGCVVETGPQAALAAAGFARAGRQAPVWQINRGGLGHLAARSAGPEAVAERRRAVSADDVATIVYTSGTTGPPKGCALTHRNLLSETGNAIAHLPQLFQPEDSCTVLFLPLAHAFARLVQFGCLAAGARLAYALDPASDLAAALSAARPTFLLGVPRVFEKLRQRAREEAGEGPRGAVFRAAEATAVAYSRALDSPTGPGVALRLRRRLADRLVYRRLRARLGGRCRHAVSGGAKLDPQLAHFFRGAGVTIYEGYGLTETSPAVTANTEGAIRIGTVGRPLPGVGIRIADDGEILVRGEVVFQGYWRDPEATAAVRDPDGWLHTGDLGELDGDGFLTLTGRIKEVLVTSTGETVAPQPLEERLRAHPLVSHSVVVGDDRPYVAALVTLDAARLAEWLAARGRPPASPAEVRHDPELLRELDLARAHANQIASHTGSVRRVRILPRDFSEARGELTPTMKVRRNVVAREYADEIDAIYRR